MEFIAIWPLTVDCLCIKAGPPVVDVLLLLAVWLVMVMLIGSTGLAHVATVVLLGMRCTLCLSVLPLLICSSGMLAFSPVTLKVKGLGLYKTSTCLYSLATLRFYSGSSGTSARQHLPRG